MKSIVPALLILIGTTTCADDAADLAKHLPASANTVTVVRLADMFGSERAQKEGWAAQQEERFRGGTAAIPPWVKTLVVGSLVHPSVPEEVWSAAVVKLPEGTTFESLAEHEGTQVEELAGAPAVRSRRNNYLMQPLPGILAVYRPAHRLEASRWVRSIAAEQPSSLSPYLSQAVGAEGHVILALDLRDLLDARRVEEHLTQDERFASQARLVERLIPLLSGLQGVTFTATVGETIESAVTIDFSDDVGPSSLTVKTLFVSVLDDLGAAIDEFTTSKVSSQGRSVTLACSLSDESLRRILSLIITPSTPHQIAASPPAESPRGTRPPAGRSTSPPDATHKYVDTVNKMIDDLQRANRRAKDYARTAAWHDNFARKIDELPTPGVDRPALIYGQHIASRFRALGASLRGQAIDINTQQRTLTYDVNYQPGWAGVSIWGGVGYQDPAYQVTSNLREVRERQAAAISAGASERDQIWQLIEDERSQMKLALPD
ncbi:MAG: hypothetical protein AB7U20_14775 [Planctomycetaceae bacterium]